ncbi:MAG: RNA polymerase sigma factor [Patescibacteria group bacterium]|nr:RNA polymerase sigma factor [Patescibacteria group bacterium]
MDSTADIRKVLQKAKKGDTEAFSLIYTDYYSPIYKYIYTRTGSKEQAEDLTQEVFLKAYRSIKSFRITDASPLAYFYTIARNAVIDFRRKQSIVKVQNLEIIEAVGDESPNAEDRAIREEQWEYVQECLQRLTEDQQEIITLKFMSGLTNKEISAMTGKSEMAIRQTQSRGLRTLGKLFKKIHV